MLAFLWNIGPLEAITVIVVILLLFGHRLPGLMRSLGRGIVEFKHGLHDTGTDEEQIEGESKPKKNLNA